MNRLSRRRWRVALAGTAILALTIGVVGGGVASADTIAELTALAEEQFEPLEELVSEDGALGVFRNGTDNVVMIPAERAGEIDAFQALFDSQLDGVLDEIRVSQFTTDALSALGETLGSREATGIGEDYAIMESYDPESDTYEIMTDAPASITDPLLAAYPGQLSTKWGTSDVYGRYDDVAPFSGAASLRSSGITCTGTVGVKDANNREFMLTAGHCYPLSSVVYGPSNYVGYVAYRNMQRDSELIYDPNGPGEDTYMWSGGTVQSAAQIHVGGYKVARQGQTNIYGSGQTTYNAKRGSVTRINVNFCPKVNSCIITNGSGFTFGGGKEFEYGDSGAPIYQLDSSNQAIMMGLLSGDMYDANNNRIAIAVTITSVLSYWKLTLVT